MEDAEAAEGDSELSELVEVDNNAGDNPEYVKDVKDGDCDKDSSEEAPEVPVLPPFNHHNQEKKVEGQPTY